MEQLEEYELLDVEYLAYEKRKMIVETGCKGPCSYKVRWFVLFSKYLLNIIFQEYKLVARKPLSGSAGNFQGRLKDR